MRRPPPCKPLIDDGVIDEVIRSLKSGKEATVYLVRSGAHTRCAKVYRDMRQRSFQKRDGVLVAAEDAREEALRRELGGRRSVR